MKIFISNLIFFDDNSFEYYQGYHELAWYFLALYRDEKEDLLNGVMVFQRYSEFYIKPFNKNCEYSNLVQIVDQIIKLSNKAVYDDIRSNFDESFMFCLQWILCSFTHNIHNPAVAYGILDYIIASHPRVIFFLSAQVLIQIYLGNNSNIPYIENKQ